MQYFISMKLILIIGKFFLLSKLWKNFQFSCLCTTTLDVFCIIPFYQAKHPIIIYFYCCVNIIAVNLKFILIFNYKLSCELYWNFFIATTLLSLPFSSFFLQQCACPDGLFALCRISLALSRKAPILSVLHACSVFSFCLAVCSVSS